MALAAGTFTRRCSPPPQPRKFGVVTTFTPAPPPGRRRPRPPGFRPEQELASAGADAVAISTPAATHVALTQQALRLGLAVACDKPFAPDAGRPPDRRAGRAARSSRYGLPEPPLGLGLPDPARAARQRSLGELTVFESRFERFRPDPGPPAAGGGTLLDFGATWPIRPWCSRVRSAACMPRCITAANPAGWMTTSSSR